MSKETLFGDSSDEDEPDSLLLAARSNPIAKPPSTNVDTTGLFDSSDEDEQKPQPTKKKLGRRPVAPSDKRSKMEALAKKRTVEPKQGVKRKTDEKGYESGDSYDSAEIQRTKEDDNFIDADGEDPDALKELYAEQNFDDERPDADSDEEKTKKTKKRSVGGGLDKIDLEEVADERADASSALVAAVQRMSKKKKEIKKLTELEDEATEFLKEMEAAADADEECIANRRPATKKLGMLPKVLQTLARRELQRPLLDLDLLRLCKRWVQPLPNGSLGNVTLRKAVFETISTMTGENGINSGDLKRSGFGKTTMALYMHKSETPAMKKLVKTCIDQWSRPIFKKSGDMRDLEKIQAVRGRIQGPARVQNPGVRGRTEDDLARIISGGSAAQAIGNNRVRVPYSKGFQFSVRPTNRTGDVSDRRNLASASAKSGALDGGKRDAISKRMVEKNRPAKKQSQRSANISIEGRVVK